MISNVKNNRDDRKAKRDENKTREEVVEMRTRAKELKTRTHNVNQELAAVQAELARVQARTSGFEEIMKCPNCRIRYNQTRRTPHILDCGHDVCRKCLHDKHRKLRKEQGRVNEIMFYCDSCGKGQRLPFVLEREDMPKDYLIINAL